MSEVVKKILKIFLLLIFSLIVLTAGLIGWIIAKPKEAWRIAEKHFLPQDFQMKWEKMNFQAKHLSGVNFSFVVEFQDLYIKKGRPFLELPVDYLRIETSVYPRNSESKWIIHDWQIRSEKTMQFRSPSKDSKNIGKNPFQSLQNTLSRTKNFFRLVKLENADINIRRFQWVQKDRPFLHLSLAASQDHKKAANVLNYKTTLRFPGKMAAELKTQGRLFLGSLVADQLRLKGTATLLSQGLRIKQNLSLDYHKDTASVLLRGPVSLSLKKRSLTAHSSARLKLTPQGADLGLNITSLTGLPGKLIKVDSAQAHLSSHFEKDRAWSQNPIHLWISTPLKIFFIDKDMRPPLEETCQCKIPEVLRARIAGQAWLDPVPALDISFSLENVDNKLFSLNSTAGLKIRKEADKYLIAPRVDVQARIHSFRGLRNFLDVRGILIPAPLSVLDGTIDFQMKGPVNIFSGGYIFPAATAVRLGSERQNVDVKAQAEIHLASDFKAAQMDVFTVIQQLQLDTPPLEPVQGKPRIIPDKRILKEPKPKTKPSQFKLAMDVQIKTARPGAVRLLSRYFDPYLPLALHLQRSSDKKNSGYFFVEPFDINYLRRKVHVEKMRVDIAQPEAAKNLFLVDGRLKVEQTHYTVFIDLQGPANKPQIGLSSTPELSRSEIISVLLYDRTSDQLVSGDAGTVGNVEAAIVDRAIGLFSLWAFASTPIKGFSYNPTTKVYTATIDVGEDVTATIGTNWEEATQVELRKRISNHWVLTVSWAPADQEEPTKLVLQWENRF